MPDALEKIRVRINEDISAARGSIRRAAEAGNHALRRQLEEELNCRLFSLKQQEGRLERILGKKDD